MTSPLGMSSWGYGGWSPLAPAASCMNHSNDSEAAADVQIEVSALLLELMNT